MTEINNGFKLDQKEWEGYVRAKLEDVSTDIKEIKSEMAMLAKCVNGVKVKVAAIGGTVSLLVTIIVLAVRYIFLK